MWWQGSTPSKSSISNLKAFVEKPRSSAEDHAILNSQFEEFCKNYNIKPKPCMPYRPQTNIHCKKLVYQKHGVEVLG